MDADFFRAGTVRIDRKMDREAERQHLKQPQKTHDVNLRNLRTAYQVRVIDPQITQMDADVFVEYERID